MDTFKINKQFCILLLSLLLFNIVLVIINITININPEVKNATQFICKDFMLNLSNPSSYINRVTKPFLIKLVKNATKNG